MAATADANVFQSDHVAYEGGFRYSPASGEAPGLAVRLGAPAGERWGVEVEFARSARVEGNGPNIGPVVRAGPLVFESHGIPGVMPEPLLVPFDFRSDSGRRLTSINAAVWLRQPVGGRVDLAYVAGVTFFRHTQDLSLFVTPLLRTVALPIVQHSRTVDYGTGALAGLDARVSLTEHVRLVPGLRLQGLSDGWLLRVSAGLGWWF